MGDDKSTGGGAAPKPKPPAIPDSAPQALKDFIDCKADSYAFADGPLEFLEVNPKPNVAYKPGATPGTATLAITAMGFTIKLPAAIDKGRLTIDTSGQWLLPGKVADDIKRFTDDLNGWFASNGKGLSPPAFGPNGMTLTKVPRAGDATQAPAPAVVAPVVIPSIDAPVAPKGGSKIDTTPKSGGPVMPYTETKVETPTPPATDVFGPKSASIDPDAGGIVYPALDMKPAPIPPKLKAGPVVGAGGPGAAMAPQGLGNLARYAIAAAIFAALGLGAVIFLGGSAPGVPATGSPSPGTAATLAPTAGIAVPTAPPVGTLAPVGTPNGAANGRFEILEDVTVSSCEHAYRIRFRVFDSTQNGAVYAGKAAVFQVLDGTALTTTVGPDGTWEWVFNEFFQKTNSGCFSILRPKVISVDGQPAF